MKAAASGRRVAIKILSDQCARNPELLERFFAEARAVNLVNHENIVSVIDMAQLPDGRPFIVMEYVEGQTLAAIVRAGPVPLGGLIQVMTEVLSALAAAHAIGIVHRDLKPDNVLVTAEGHAKVLDFGIAKLAPERGARPISARVVTSDSCDARLVRAPRCGLASVWNQALAKAIPSDVVARIGWLFDESWLFDIDFAGKGGGVSSFADRCP